MDKLNREQLEIEKLKEEIRTLKRPFWKSPPYLTIFATALIAAISYTTGVDKELTSQIEELEQKERALKEQSLRWEIEASVRRLALREQASAEVDRKILQNYATGYASGVMKSTSGQEALARIGLSPQQQRDIEKFASNVVRQALNDAAEQREKELEKSLKRLGAN